MSSLYRKSPIATLAKLCSNKGYMITIITGKFHSGFQCSSCFMINLLNTSGSRFLYQFTVQQIKIVPLLIFCRALEYYNTFLVMLWECQFYIKYDQQEPNRYHQHMTIGKICLGWMGAQTSLAHFLLYQQLVCLFILTCSVHRNRLMICWGELMQRSCAWNSCYRFKSFI